MELAHSPLAWVLWVWDQHHLEAADLCQRRLQELVRTDIVLLSPRLDPRGSEVARI